MAYHPVGVGLVVNNVLPEGRGFYAATRGRRVLPVTMGHHHKPFESAETARGLRGVPSIWSERSSHCGAQSAVGRAIKAFDHRIGERYTTVAAPACSEPPERARMDTKISQRGLCVARDGTSLPRNR